MKRKADETGPADGQASAKKAATATTGSTNGNAHPQEKNFGEGIFSQDTLKIYQTQYAASSPYKHAVVSNLIDDSLLRSVRSEIVQHIHFSPKETDIYKIHQSGDLANLDGLDASALEKLPSLLLLRDSLYSYDFRQWLSRVTGAGLLSGKKTDMAVNLYVPGCHLLCHDDVIGSRRVSYILYLTDPDQPWQASWGGALRLYPTDEVKDEDGKTFKLPQSEWSKVIPPAWNQLSFFAVQPGESFHDVEEVYKRTADHPPEDGRRFRMAISGWFHIPQEGEEGFEPGLEEKLAERSSLQQLQGKADQFDEPQLVWHDPASMSLPDSTKAAEDDDDDEEDTELSEDDLEFLLKFITPNYLTPDTVEELNEMFTETSTLQLANFFSAKFSEKLKAWIEEGKAGNSGKDFKTSRPPHKHRYQYINSKPDALAAQLDIDNDPFQAVLNGLLPSLSFRKWLSLITGLTLERCSVLARRFRRGLDYQLAQGYEGEDPQLEYCLCVTPSKGWAPDDEEDAAQENGASEVTGKAKVEETKQNGSTADEEDNCGGYELYMAGEDADEEDDAEGSDDGVEIPAKVQSQSQTGAGNRRNAKQKKADPAIYKAAADGDDEDDGILLSLPAAWNTLSIALRDQGTLKFVKYVSQSAPGDRYDFAGCFGVDLGDEQDDDDEDDEDE